MQRSPYLIVKEFCDSENEQQRKNAATALAALADPEGLEELVRMGLYDPSPAVTERVESELSTLPPKERAEVLQALAAKLREPGEESRRAYWFMGRLPALGVVLPPLNVPLRRRLWLAKSLRHDAYSEPGFKGRMRGWAGSLAGSAVTAVALAVIVALTHHDEAQSFLLTSPFIAIALSVLSMQFASPIALHADRMAAACLDLLITAVAAIPLAAIAAVALGENDASLNEEMAGAFMILTLAVFTRAFMLAEIGLTASTKANRWLGICCGAAAGAMAMSLVPVLLGAEGNTGISNLWFMLLPVSVGLSVAWSQQDVAVPGRMRVPLIIRLSGFLVLAAFLVLVSSLISLQTIRDVHVPSTITVNVRSLPLTMALRTDADSLVTISERAEPSQRVWSPLIYPHGLAPGSTGGYQKVTNMPNGTQTADLRAGVWDLKVEWLPWSPRTLLEFVYSNLLFAPRVATVSVRFEPLTANAPDSPGR